MAFVTKAREFPNRYEFEVCQSQPADCARAHTSADHQAYTWTRADNDMTVDDMLREIRLLEGVRTSPPSEGQRLAQEGRNLKAV